jgi:eukaryotic-like serine/threonine-protein kinase
MLNLALDAAHNLVGSKLKGGWTVIEKVEKEHNGTGGHFSVSYIVEHEKCGRAFLKVLDLGRALTIPGDQLKNIEALTSQFNFERDTLKVCREYRLKRVAGAIEDGKLDLENNPFGVYYIIFELADGDLRKRLNRIQSVDFAWKLRTLHHTAVGINQLHQKKIAHQDVKPSNVLTFQDREAKVADLGCADIKGKACPRGGFPIAGDRGYAPPELLYGNISPNWEQRRIGTDMYQFGSLATFLFTQLSITAVLIDHLHPPHRPGLWPHDYRMVLPYVRDAFGKTIQDIRTALPAAIRSDVAHSIELLCDPDPSTRGHPKDLNNQQFNFERFVSLFDRLAERAEHGLIKQ